MSKKKHDEIAQPIQLALKIAEIKELLCQGVMPIKLFNKNRPGQNQTRFDFKLWISFSIIAIAMICLWLHGAAQIYSVYASLQWPSTTGTVIRSEIQSSGGSYRTSAPTKEAIIVYRYRLNGVVFSSDRVFWGNPTFHSAFSEPNKLVRKYLVGKTVSVYYNPEKPAESVLERRARILYYGIVGFCSFILFLQVYFLVHVWRKK